MTNDLHLIDIYSPILIAALQHISILLYLILICHIVLVPFRMKNRRKFAGKFTKRLLNTNTRIADDSLTMRHVKKPIRVVYSSVAIR